jgi:uncharacterized membrane protein
VTQVEIDDAEWASPDNWHLGSLYFSRRDSRAFVPKRNCPEAGATINFARPAGAGLLLGIVIFVALLFALARIK